MEQNDGKWLAGTLGLIGGMTKYTHMVMIGDTLLLNVMIQPMITGALTVVAGLIAKDLYRWAKIPFMLHFVPWVKTLFKKRKP